MRCFVFVGGGGVFVVHVPGMVCGVGPLLFFVYVLYLTDAEALRRICLLRRCCTCLLFLFVDGVCVWMWCPNGVCGFGWVLS